MFLLCVLVGCTFQMVQVSSTPHGIQKPTEVPTVIPTPQVIETRRVTAETLNVRTGPDETFPRVSDTLFLYAGEFLRVYEVKDGWLRIHPRWDWWVNGEFTK